MISDQATFASHMNRIEKILKVDRRLPSMVFGDEFRSFRFADFDWSMGSELWMSVRTLCMPNENVLVAVLDPDPVTYFYKEFSSYNFFELPADASRHEYWKSLTTGPNDSPADAPAYNANLIVWIPSSADWAIWSQRDVGLCVVGSRARDLEGFSEQRWLKSELAPGVFLSKSAPDISEALLHNYREG